jgi:hypothetical protein
MKASKTILALLASSALLGCGSSDNTCTDAGCPDGGGSSADTGPSAPDGPMLWGLSRDMNNYKVTNVTVMNDGCMLMPAALMGMAIPANYSATTNTFSLGKDFGTPAMPAFGSGTVGANMATLTRDNQAGDPTKCYWHQKDVSMMKLFDHDKFTLDVTETEDMFSAAGCTGMDAPPAGGMCTSTFQLTLEIQK